METNRTSSFPAETVSHRPNYGYTVASVLAVPTSLATAGTYWQHLRGEDTAVAGAVALLLFLAYAYALASARLKTNRRLRAYREKNPDVELLHGP